MSVNLAAIENAPVSEAVLAGSPVVAADWPGAITLNQYRAAEVLVRPEDFTHPIMRQLWEQVVRLVAAGNRPTSDVMRAELGDDTQAQAGLLHAYCSVVLPRSIGYHAKRVVEHSCRRNAAAMARQIAEDAYTSEGKPETLADRLANAADEVRRRSTLEGAEKVSLAVEQYWAAFTDEKNSHRVYTQFPRLDGILGGIGDTDLVILAARPSVGKSAAAGHITRNICEQGGGVLWFSFEMGRQQILDRMLAGICRLSNKNLRQGKYRDNETAAAQIKDGLQKIMEWPLWIADRSDRTVETVAAEARRRASQEGEYPLRMVVVDYIQQMTGANIRQNATLREHVTAASNGLKALAMELKIPVLAVAQLSREADYKAQPGKRQPHNSEPALKDLKESGSLEQDADTVIFLHRTAPATPENGQVAQIKMLIAKQRSGPLGAVPFSFMAENQIFHEHQK